MTYFTSKDIEILNENIENISNEGNYQSITKLEPTKEEFFKVRDFILNYIKEHNLIIYGGYSLNQLLIKNKFTPIYNDNEIKSEEDFYDLEFYSFRPYEHIKELCDKLHEAKFENISGSEAMHPETFTIFVNFRKYCDISYMPANIFYEVPLIQYNGFKFIHPHFALIDKLRVFTTPLISYFRLEKDYNRFNIILNAFPFENKECKIKTETEEPINYIIKEIIPNNKLILFNYYAFNYYDSLVNTDQKTQNKIPYIDCISLDYVKDYLTIYNQLKDKYKTDISIKEYHPFFQFLNRHITIYYKDNPLINIFKHNNNCIPYNKHKDTYITSFSMTILLMLYSKYLNQIVHLNYDEKNNLECMINKLLKLRTEYFETNNKTIIDDTPFKEFVIDCIGQTITIKRQNKLLIKERIELKKKARFEYFPDSDKHNYDPNDFSLPNSSGNINNKFKL